VSLTFFTVALARTYEGRHTKMSVFDYSRHFFGSVNLGASSATLRSTILLTEEAAGQLGTTCPWKIEGESEDFRFLERVMRT